MLCLGSGGLLFVLALTLRGGKRLVGDFGGASGITDGGILGVMCKFVLREVERCNRLRVKARSVTSGPC